MDVIQKSNMNAAIQWIMAKLNSMERNAKKLKRDMKGLRCDLKDIKDEIKGLNGENDPCIQILRKWMQGIYIWYHSKSANLKQ